MNNEKVTIPREVAEAIEYAKNVHTSLTNVLDDVFNCRGGSDRKMQLITEYFDGNEIGLMRALVNGYEIEKSPEEKLREYYNDLTKCFVSDRYAQGAIESLRHTLNTLGITIEGINA